MSVSSYGVDPAPRHNPNKPRRRRGHPARGSRRRGHVGRHHEAECRRAAARRPGLQAGAEPELERLLELRHLVLDHLDPRRLLHHLRRRRGTTAARSRSPGAGRSSRRSSCSSASACPSWCRPTRPRAASTGGRPSSAAPRPATTPAGSTSSASSPSSRRWPTAARPSSTSRCRTVSESWAAGYSLQRVFIMFLVVLVLVGVVNIFSSQLLAHHQQRLGVVARRRRGGRRPDPDLPARTSHLSRQRGLHRRASTTPAASTAARPTGCSSGSTSCRSASCSRSTRSPGSTPRPTCPRRPRARPTAPPRASGARSSTRAIGGYVLLLAFVFAVQDIDAVTAGGGGVAVIFDQALSSPVGGHRAVHRGHRSVLLLDRLHDEHLAHAVRVQPRRRGAWCLAVGDAVQEQGPGQRGASSRRSSPCSSRCRRSSRSTSARRGARSSCRPRSTPSCRSAVIGLYVAFAIPIFLRWRMGDAFKQGSWNLGQQVEVDGADRGRRDRHHLGLLHPPGHPGGHPGQRGLRVEVRQLRTDPALRRRCSPCGSAGTCRPRSGSPGRRTRSTCPRACPRPTRSRSSTTTTATSPVSTRSTTPRTARSRSAGTARQRGGRTQPWHEGCRPPPSSCTAPAARPSTCRSPRGCATAIAARRARPGRPAPRRARPRRAPRREPDDAAPGARRARVVGRARPRARPRRRRVRRRAARRGRPHPPRRPHRPGAPRRSSRRRPRARRAPRRARARRRAAPSA